MSSNQIVDIGFLEKLSHIQTLDLNDNQITDISILGKLTELKDLNLQRNPIKSYNLSKSLSHLKTLNLSSNQITDFQVLEKFPQLLTLDLSGCTITDFRVLGEFHQLRTLNLSHTKIADVRLLKKLTQLQNLNLNHCQIASIQVLEKFFQLRNLSLKDNQIVDIHSLEPLTKLKAIDLSFNQITDIRCLKNLTQLQNLDLSYNQITDVRYLKNLAQLQEVNLKNNRITDIRSLDELTQLKTLDLTGNRIQEFSGNLLKTSPSLRDLYISGNPINDIPKDHFEGVGKNALLDLQGYFTSIQQGSIINDEVKLIVIGNATTGKTSLMRFVREGKYDQTQSSTHGIKLTRWLVPHAKPDLWVNIWDFGGQEYYHATHRLFLDEHAVYIVVWEVSTNEECIIETDIFLSGKKYKLPLEHFPYSYWLDSVRNYAPKSNILLVQNKTDKTKEQDDFKSTDNVAAYYLSVERASQSDSVAKARFNAFKAQLIHYLKEDAVKHKLGKGWIAIRDAIRNLSKSNPKDKSKTHQWMTVAEFDAFCQQAVAAVRLQYDADTERTGLLTYLSGAASTIIYYKDEPLLQDIVFLNPQWVTDTIYNVLSYDIREQKENPGEFKREHVEQILNEKGIGKLTDAFLKLMKIGHFELIFEKPKQKDSDEEEIIYIAPQYLPDTPGQKHVDKYRRKTQHSFTLHFLHFLPRSVFLRFIVRYGNLAKEIYWKYGIVLEKNEADILVECLFRERKIRVAIEGNPESKYAQELFDELWKLSVRKPEIELSIDEMNFVEIGELKDCIDQVPKIKSKQGNWLNVEAFFHLFGKQPIGKVNNSIESITPVLTIPEPVKPEIFFSYAWGDANETGESREKIVDDLYDSLEKDNYKLVRDKKDLGYKGKISEFMQRIGKSQLVIVVISDKYLKSPYCMFELLEIYRNSRFEEEEFAKVIFPIRVENILLNKVSTQNDYYDYWESEEKEWKALIDRHRVSEAQTNTYHKVCKIHNELGDLLGHLSDMNSLTKELLSADNFAKIKAAINERISWLSKD